MNASLSAKLAPGVPAILLGSQAVSDIFTNNSTISDRLKRSPGSVWAAVSGNKAPYQRRYHESSAH